VTRLFGGTGDGRTFLFPAMAELTRRGGELSSVLVYADVSGLA
jgi:hypothetical protein